MKETKPVSKKRKFNDFKKTRFAEDANEKLIEEEKKHRKDKDDKREYEGIGKEESVSRQKNNEKEIVSASALKFVKEVVKLNKSQYDIVTNNTITYEAQDNNIKTRNCQSMKSFLEIMTLFQGCYVNIHKNPTIDNQPSEKGVKVNVTIDSVITFSLIIIKNKDYVDYQPINIMINLNDDHNIFSNELEIPISDLCQLIHILNSYKSNKNNNNN